MTCITLPWPPLSGNHQHGQNSGRRFLRREIRVYRAEVWSILAQTPRLEPPVALEIVLHPPDKRRRDADNVLKVLMDAIVASGWLRDDSNRVIQQSCHDWGEPVRGGKVVISAREVGV